MSAERGIMISFFLLTPVRPYGLAPHEPDRFWYVDQKRKSASIFKSRGRFTLQIIEI